MEYNINNLILEVKNEIHIFKIKFSEEDFENNECVVFRNIEGKKVILGKLINGKKIDKWVDWFNNGQIKIREFYQKGKLHGEQVKWFDNGKIRSTINYLEGGKNGEYQLRYKNGVLKLKMFFIEDKPKPGQYIEYYEEGDIHKKLTFECGLNKWEKVYLKQYVEYEKGHFSYEEPGPDEIFIFDGISLSERDPNIFIPPNEVDYEYVYKKTGEYKSEDVKIGWWIDNSDNNVSILEFYNETGDLEIQHKEYQSGKQENLIFENDNLIEEHIYEEVEGEMRSTDIKIYNGYGEEISEIIYYGDNQIGVKVIDEDDYINQELRIYGSYNPIVELPDDQEIYFQIPYIEERRLMWRDIDWYRIKIQSLSQDGTIFSEDINGYYEMEWNNPEDVILEKGL